MNIIINDSRKIYTIQEEFNTAFPYLRLEFFSRPHNVGGASAKKQIKSNNKTLGECRTIQKEGSMEISAQTTVAELEQDFKRLFGLNVQVFRKSGKVWLETTVTDSWTLAEQNEQGEALSLMHNN